LSLERADTSPAAAPAPGAAADGDPASAWRRRRDAGGSIVGSVKRLPAERWNAHAARLAPAVTIDPRPPHRR
jgi:hypothetical protein